MLKELRHNPRALALAVLVHVAFIAALVVSLDWTHRPAPTAQVETVQATVVDETKVRSEQAKLKEAERRKQEEEQQRLKKLEQEAERAKQAREEEQQRLTELKTQRKAEAERLAKLRQEQDQQRAAEQKRQAEQQRLVEEKAKKDEQKRLAGTEAKRKIEEEKKLRQAEARRNAEQQLKKQLDEEEQAAADKAREAAAQSIIAQYTSLIEQKVRRNWLRPASAKEGMSCTVRVRLLPGGEVSDVRVVASSGDELFDRSVVTAVYKASPLPLPPDAPLFDYFRELEFVFKP